MNTSSDTETVALINDWRVGSVCSVDAVDERKVYVLGRMVTIYSWTVPGIFLSQCLCFPYSECLLVFHFADLTFLSNPFQSFSSLWDGSWSSQATNIPLFSAFLQSHWCHCGIPEKTSWMVMCFTHILFNQIVSSLSLRLCFIV